MIADSADMLASFEQHGLSRASMVRRDQLRTILNELLVKHGTGKTSILSMPTEIEAQLWQKTTGNQNGQVILADYILTLERAQDMLLQKMQATQASRRQTQQEIDSVRNLIERAKLQNDDQSAQRLIDRLRHLGLDSVKYDEELESYKDDLKLITVPFGKGGHTIFKEVRTTVQTVEIVTVEKEAINPSVHNRSYQNISANNVLNISRQRSGNPLNISQGSIHNRSLLDTSAQRPQNISNFNPNDSFSRPPPPIPLAFPSLTPQDSSPSPILVEQKIITTTTAQSTPYHPQILPHSISPHPQSLLGPEYQNNRLYYIFWLSVLLFFFELFQMIQKPLMLGVMVAMITVGMFVLKRFNTTNLKWTSGLMGLSVVLDIVWVCVRLRTFLAKDCGTDDCLFNVIEAQHKWPYEIYHRGLHITIVVMVFITMFLKIVISMLMLSLRYDTYIENEKCIRLFGHQLLINDQAQTTTTVIQSYAFSPANS